MALLHGRLYLHIDSSGHGCLTYCLDVTAETTFVRRGAGNPRVRVVIRTRGAGIDKNPGALSSPSPSANPVGL